MLDKRVILPEIASRERYITAYRDYTHPKGEKLMFSIPDGDPLPKGVIIGKGCHLIIEEVVIPLTIPEEE